MEIKFDEALANIVLTAYRPDGYTGIFTRVGLSYNSRFDSWIEVHDKGAHRAAPLASGLYLKVRPAGTISTIGALSIDSLGLPTCPGCEFRSSSWCPDTETVTFCHHCAEA